MAHMLNGHVRPIRLLLKSCRPFTGLHSAPTMPPIAGSHCYHPQRSPPKPILLTRHISDLGLRSKMPPDSIPDSGDPSAPPEIPDQDWEIRTGRAIYVIQETLPEFFDTGLITSVNKTTGVPSSSFASSSNNPLELPLINDHEEPIYSHNIKMSYTPPSQLPAPFPKSFKIEGQQMYLASSGIIRHTMNALYSDPIVRIIKLVINSPPPIPSSAKGGKRRINRDKSFLVRHTVIGTSRVSGKPHEWEIESTYTFSPNTGLIHQHVVNSILPAPHLAVYDSLRLTLGKLLGWEPGSGATTNGAVWKNDLTNGKH